MGRARIRAAVAAFAVLAAVVPASLASAAPSPFPRALPAPVPCEGCFAPKATTKPWQVQFQGRVRTDVTASFFDIDMDHPAKTVDTLHAGGAEVACYVNAGAWESFRSDADAYPGEVLGKEYEGYPDERWLDIRRIDLLAPVLEARVDRCRAKGFDGIDPDNLNGFENDTGFPLTEQDQLEFNTWFANMAHAKGLAVGLKNDGPHAALLEPYFDWVIVEECFEQRLCGEYQSFPAAGKPVYEIEYRDPTRPVCRKAKQLEIAVIFKRPALRAGRKLCSDL